MPPRKSKGRQGSEAPAIPTGRRGLTVAEISELISINRKTVSAWCLTHRLPAARIGGRWPWRITSSGSKRASSVKLKAIGRHVRMKVQKMAPGLRGSSPHRFPNCGSGAVFHIEGEARSECEKFVT